MGREAQDAIAQAFAQGQERWPKLRLTAEAYTAHVEALYPGLDPSALQDVQLIDLVLAASLTQGDPAAISVFEAEYLAPVAPRLRRYVAVGIEDLMQELRTRLLVASPQSKARIALYTGQGPLTAWVRTAAIRLGINTSQQMQKAAQRDQLAWAEKVATHVEVDPELNEVRRRYAGALSEAYRDAARQLDPEQRAILYLSVGRRVGIDRLAKMYGLHRSTVARRVSAAKEALADLTRRAALKRISASPATMSSIEQLIHSQVDISFTALQE